MTKPEDIPQDVWNQAKRLVFDFPRPSVIESIARAIMAAKAEERERAALIAEEFGQYQVSYEIASAIRNRDTV